MRHTALFLTIGSLLVLAGCFDTGNGSVQRLDEMRGIQGLRLGDSLYSPFYRQVLESSTNWEVIEHELFGNTIVPSQEYEDVDHRFVYGVLMETIYAGAINGSVHFYTFVNVDADSSAIRRILDSLIVNYGQPTSNWDSTFVDNGESGKVWRKEWEGNEVRLTYSGNDIGIINLRVADISSAKVIQRMDERIQQLQTQSHPVLDTLDQVGRLPLFATKEDFLQNYEVEVEERDAYSGDGTITTYKIDYTEYLEPFFEVENRAEAYSPEDSATEAELEFSETTDSLSGLTVSFDREAMGDSRWSTSEFMSYSDMLTKLGKKLGQYSFEDKLRTKEGMYRQAFWIGDEVSV